MSLSWKNLLARSLGVALPAALLGGCIGSQVSYSPRDHMITLLHYNHFLTLGPCGSPWNYDDQTFILLPESIDHADAAQLQAYRDGPAKVLSGSVAVDRAVKRLTTDLVLADQQDVHTTLRMRNVRYTEHDPSACEATRDSIAAQMITAGPTTQSTR